MDAVSSCFKETIDKLEQARVKISKVQHPTHYNRGIECWDYIVSHGMNFLEGNVIKYVTRYKYKNNKEDLLKAKEYLEKLIEVQGGDGN